MLQIAIGIGGKELCRDLRFREQFLSKYYLVANFRFTSYSAQKFLTIST